MTEKIFLKDSYIKEFYATVLKAENCNGYYKIILDKTAFFPQGGGQMCDTGYIDNTYVYNVQIEKGIIYHYTKEFVEGTVFCKIDFDKRFCNMQCHTGEHILSGVAVKTFDVVNVGFNLAEDYVTVDYNKVLTNDDIAFLEAECNKIIYQNKKITCTIPDKATLSSLSYRCKKEILEEVRIVDIDGVDTCACCAPHLNSTAQVGIIKIIDKMNHRGGTRLFMLAGKRAFDYLCTIFNQNKEISVALSSQTTNTFSYVKKLLEERDSLYGEMADLNKALALELARNIAHSRSHIIHIISPMSNDGLTTLFNKGKEKTPEYFCLLYGSEGNYNYMIGSHRLDITTHIKELNSILNGRGGGKKEMVRGTFKATYKEIEAAFNNIKS